MDSHAIEQAVIEQAVIEQAVIEHASTVLAVDPATLSRTRKLTDLPTFSSFRIVDIVERVERSLGLEVDAALLTPDNLHDLAGLCTVFLRSAQLLADRGRP